jgi:hypothetical protein
MDIKTNLKQTILSIVNGDTEEASDFFRKYLAMKNKSLIGITEDDDTDDVNTDDTETDLEEVRFSLKDDENVKKTKDELKRTGVEFDTEEDGDITYFQFPNVEEFEKGNGIAEKVIDKLKEQ